MHKFVVKQPIKTDEHKLVGNELLFNVENELYNQNVDYSAAETISAFLSQNTDKIEKEAKTFITFTPNLLFKNIPKMFKQETTEARKAPVKGCDNAYACPPPTDNSCSQRDSHGCSHSKQCD